MKKSIVKIIISFLIPITFFVIVIILLKSMESLTVLERDKELNINYDVDELKINIDVQKEGTLNITETLKIMPRGQINAIYQDIDSKTHFLFVEDDVKIYLNGKKVNKNNIVKKNQLLNNYNIISFNKTTNPIVITYKYSIKDCYYISKYKDLAVFEYSIPTAYANYIKKLDININLPKETENFNINDKNNFGKCIKGEKTSKSYHIYKYNLKKQNLFFSSPIYTKIKVSFDSDIINTPIMRNYNAPESQIKYESSNNQYQVNDYINIFLLGVLVIITIIMSIYYFLIKRINKKSFDQKLDYYRDVDKLISPELASIVINKRFKIKEYIISTLVILLNQNKIKIEDNKTITILDLERIKDEQKEVLKLIYNTNIIEVGMKIEFDEINKEFNCKGSLYRIKEKVKKIKDIAIQNLYSSNIYDEYLATHLKEAKQFSFVNMYFVILSFVIYVVLLMEDLIEIYSIVYLVLIVLNIITLILGKWFKIDVDKKYDSLINKFSKKDKDTAKFKIEFMFVSICVLFSFIIEFNIMFILSVILLLLNVHIFILQDDEIFTENGYLEYDKLCGLKRFIEDFSFLNEKEFKDNILWKKYLEYAVAFDISKKMTKKLINADIFNLNLVINDVEKIVSIF